MTYKAKRTHVSLDFAIKHLLRQKAYQPILEGLLSCLLGISVKVKTVLESESNIENELLKISRIDIVVESTDGAIIVLEHQFNRQTYFLQRVIFGVSRILVDHLPKGQTYSQLKKVISTNILYFLMYPDMTDYIYDLKAELVGRHDGSIIPVSVTSDAPVCKNQKVVPSYHFIIVNNLTDTKNNLNHLEQWVYFLKYSAIARLF